MRKLKEGETFVASVFVPVAWILLYVYAIVDLGWFGGAFVNIFVFMAQMFGGIMVLFLLIHLILKYAGEKDISHKPYICLE